MIPRALPLALILLFALSGAASAECYADYKASRGDDPLELQYGVIRLNDAECANPQAAIARRIGGDGWQLLAVLGTFDENGAKQRQADAGAYYLRY
ncbi:hypothetical protein [Palleronia aestuarii]|uniref:hypothetical protein n=1 Tax=Palleronia aestuarii TaxID=568105 RepID=UPI0027E3C6CF|nr:hypothetical protein [Palleronia aestuarii]